MNKINKFFCSLHERCKTSKNCDSRAVSRRTEKAETIGILKDETEVKEKQHHIFLG